MKPCCEPAIVWSGHRRSSLETLFRRSLDGGPSLTEKFPTSLPTAPSDEHRASLGPRSYPGSCSRQKSPSLTPFGLVLHSGFFQSSLGQLVCWSLNPNFTKVPAE